MECYELTTIIIAIATLFCSFATVVFAYVASSTIAKNHVKTRQVEAMSQLVEYLNNTKIQVCYLENYSDIGGGSFDYGILYNVFELGRLLNSDLNNSISGRPLGEPAFDDAPIVITKDFNFEIKRFIDNPFVPSEIANNLVNFHISLLDKDITRREMPIGKFVALGSIQNKQYNQPTGFAYKTWLNLKQCSYDLTTIIANWFKENGIENFNLRNEDFKNKQQIH